MLAAYYARDYRDAITRHERFLQISAASEMRVSEHRNETSIEWKWKRGRQQEPPLLTDVTYAMLVEMGRRGTEQPFNLDHSRRYSHGPIVWGHRVISRYVRSSKADLHVSSSATGT
jgi:hypothetical protein